MGDIVAYIVPKGYCSDIINIFDKRLEEIVVQLNLDKDFNKFRKESKKIIDMFQPPNKLLLKQYSVKLRNVFKAYFGSIEEKPDIAYQILADAFMAEEEINKIKEGYDVK